ncbi:MAG: hypothetical protein ACR2LX_02700 [Jatrophihabitans sp.]
MVRRGLRTRTGRWALAALAGLVVLLVGLLRQGALTAPASSPTAPPAAGGIGVPSIATGMPPVSPSSPPARSTRSAINGGDQTVLRTLRSQFPDNPLNHLNGGAFHQVTIEARSASQYSALGWLIPTGLSNTFGSRNNVSRTWTLSQRAIGKGYLAAVFLQAGRDGTPVTCRVIVDGKVTDTKTTSGSYGRTVCVG